MARYSLNFDRLPLLVQQAARDANLSSVCRNPFQSIVVRAVEVLYAVDEALRIIAAYSRRPVPQYLAEGLAKAPGSGCTEAPRGILFHRYRLNADGTIADAKIVPPTSQNQKAIENDLWRFVEQNLVLSTEALTGMLRAGGPELRSLHLVRDAFSQAAARPPGVMATSTLIVGVSNAFRRPRRACARDCPRKRPCRGRRAPV